MKLFISYSHKDEDYHRRLVPHLNKLRDEGRIEPWDDRKILAGQDWDEKIARQLENADMVVCLLSPNFFESEYIREKEIPKAVERAERHDLVIVPVLLEACDWKQYGLGRWQALPIKETPVAEWPDIDWVYVQVALAIAARAESLTEGVMRAVRQERKKRWLTIYQHTPFQILGEDYDPFHAFEEVFRLVEGGQLGTLPPLPLEVPLGDRVEFVREDYQTILARLRDGHGSKGLPYDLVAIPYPALGHCVERGLIRPLDESILGKHESRFAWWHEMGTYRGELYGVPLSSLTMILAVREDLFSQFGLSLPDTWQDYLSVIDEVIERRLPIAPDLLQGRRHITLWYDWLNHLYANDANDLALYGHSRLPAQEAAEKLRDGTASYLTLAAKLASYNKQFSDLPHWATANWDDGIEWFAKGRLLTHFLFNDALQSLRQRMEVTEANGRAGTTQVRFLPVPRAKDSAKRNGHVEGWVLCLPSSSRYDQAANEVLDWFLQPEVQREYARFGGTSARREIIEGRVGRRGDGGAGTAHWDSVADSLQGRTVVDLVKSKGPYTPVAVDRIVGNLYQAILAVARDSKSIDSATTDFIRRVKRRLQSPPA